MALTVYGLERLDFHFPAITFAEGYRYKVTGTPLTYKDCQTVSLHLDTDNDHRTYFTLQALFGHAFVIGLLQYYEAIEDYERCLKIADGIRYMNKIAKTNFSTYIYATNNKD